jgi:hypothetical protein
MDVLFSQGDERVELSASIKATKHSKEKITVCSFPAELTPADQCPTNRRGGRVYGTSL